jgi:cell division septation protein DedD
MVRPLVLLAAVSLLTACGDGPLLQGGGATTGDAPAEVLDAAVFQESANALWDGRPSLGGVWIAHPDATTPERVNVRNDDSGRVIQAALFRRERDFPGPPFQLSADAAAALGAEAGTPTPVTVTALRRVPVAPPPEAEAELAADDPELAAGEGEAAGSGDTGLIAAADAAIDEAMGDVPAGDPAAAEAEDPGGSSMPGSFPGSSAPQNTGVNDPALSPEEAAALMADAEAEAALMAEEPAAEDAPKGGSAGSMPGTKPVLVDDTGTPIPAEETPAITATALTGEPPEAPETGPEPEASLEAASLPAAQPAAASDLERPYVQVASGSTRANVDALAAKLQAAGLPALVRETSQEGAPLWYVVVGPAASQGELDALLARIRELGYPDAFIAKG